MLNAKIYTISVDNRFFKAYNIVMISYARKKDKDKKSIKRLLPLFFTAFTLALILIIQSILRKNKAVAEWMSLNFSSRIASFMGRFSSLVPFSIFEWLVILFFISVITLLVLGIIALFKRRFRAFTKGFAVFMTVILSLLNIYILSAGYMYYRKTVDIPSTSMAFKVYKNEEAEAITDFFINRINALSKEMDYDTDGSVISPYNNSELNSLLMHEYKRLDNGYFFEYTPHFKTLTNSWFMSSNDYSGVTFLPLGEPSVNKLMPVTDFVFTAAHELAHAKGVMRENEANMTAYHLLLTSQNSFLQYCGIINYLYEIPTIAYLGNNKDYDLYSLYRDKISGTVKKDYNNAVKYWSDYVGPLDWLGNWFTQIGDWFNNLYLKSNGAPDGTGSYRNPWDVIDTGEKDPDTGLPIYDPVYSNLHKIMFYVYEQAKSA